MQTNMHVKTARACNMDATPTSVCGVEVCTPAGSTGRYAHRIIIVSFEFSELTVPGNASFRITGVVLFCPRLCCLSMMVQCDPYTAECRSLLCCYSLSCNLERNGDGLSAGDGGRKRHGRGCCRPVH